MTISFNPVAQLAIRKKRARAFQVLFDVTGPLGDEAELVLAALRDYCRANSTTIGMTDQETYVNNGKREVWLFLNSQLQFDDTTIRNLVEAADDYLE